MILLNILIAFVHVIETVLYAALTILIAVLTLVAIACYATWKVRKP